MTNRKFFIIGGCGLVFLGGGVLFGVLELRDWKAEKKAEQVLIELQQRQEQREQKLQDALQILRNYNNSRKDGSKKHRQDVLETLEIILQDFFYNSGDLYDKLKAACLRKKTDGLVEQLFEEAVAISIKTEGKNDGGEEENRKLKQLLRSYYGLKDVTDKP